MSKNPGLKEEVCKELIRSAVKAKEFSYSPYSHFSVGAALLTDDNKIFTGTNIESASYSLCICAERVAFSKALSEGSTKFKAIAVITSADKQVYPCGACRQFMYEFGGDLEVIIASGENDYTTAKLSELLPGGFDNTFFK